MKFFKEMKKDVRLDGGRGFDKSVHLPVIEYPKTIFSQKKKKKKHKIVTGTQLSGFLRSNSERSKKKKYFLKGKLHTVQREYIERNGYDASGKLISSKKFKKKIKKSKKKKRSKVKSVVASKLVEDEASELLEEEYEESEQSK